MVKNYIATEFLYDYLKDKRSVGVIDEDAERAIRYVAEPIGVVLALTPITNPTSTVLFKAIVAAKTRNAIIFRPSARAAAAALERPSRSSEAAGERAGMPPDTLQVIPDPTLDVSQYLFHHPGVDFIWTTGGPKAVAAANAAGKPCLSVGAGNAPVYIHRSADVPMAAVDMLISKTFDASADLPGRADVHRRRARLGRDRSPSSSASARGCSTRTRWRRWPSAVAFDGRAPSSSPRSASRAPNLGAARRLRGRDRRQGPARAAAVGPRRAGRHPLVAREADARARARALAVGGACDRSRRGDHRARRPRPHLRRLRDRRRRDRRVLHARPHRADPRQRADRGRRAGRRLQRDDADLLARLRHLGRVGHHRQHQLPQPAERQGGVAAPDAAAVVPRPVGHLLQPRLARDPADAAAASRR